MTPEWQAFLQSQNASIENARVVHFGQPQAELEATVSGTVISDLSQLGLIALSGTDAVSFLQGQFANDVRQVTAQTSQLNVYCSPKGRALAIFRLFQRADRYYLLLPQDILEHTLKRLRMFVLRAQVTLHDASHELIRIGIAGAAAETQLKSVLGFSPDLVNAVMSDQENKLTLLRIPSPYPRFVVVGEIQQAINLWSALSGQATRSATAWSLLDIQAGIPTIYPATADAFVPQMLNLDASGGISFTKGCYPGQEIVARMHYLGTLKRRMYRAYVESPQRPEPGAELYSAEHEQSVGAVVDAQPVLGGGFELLAVIQIAHAQEARLANRQGPLLQILALPYGVEQ